MREVILNIQHFQELGKDVPFIREIKLVPSIYSVQHMVVPGKEGVNLHSYNAAVDTIAKLVMKNLEVTETRGNTITYTFRTATDKDIVELQENKKSLKQCRRRNTYLEDRIKYYETETVWNFIKRKLNRYFYF